MSNSKSNSKMDLYLEFGKISAMQVFGAFALYYILNTYVLKNYVGVNLTSVVIACAIVIAITAYMAVNSLM